MTWTYDPTTDLGKVRLLARENIQASSVLQDEDIQAFLDMQDANLRLAAADALDHIADSQVLLLKKVGLGSGALTTDGPAVADALRRHASILRAQDASAEEDEGIDWAEWPLTNAGWREILYNERVRTG